MTDKNKLILFSLLSSALEKTLVIIRRNLMRINTFMIIVSPNVFKNAVNQLKGKIMKKAKLTRAICLMFALLTVISILSISAFATEPSNTYNFSFSTAGYTRYSSAVSKSSASSCYVYYSSGNAPYFVAAAGGTNANGNSHIDCSGG